MTRPPSFLSPHVEVLSASWPPSYAIASFLRQIKSKNELNACCLWGLLFCGLLRGYQPNLFVTKRGHRLGFCKTWVWALQGHSPLFRARGEPRLGGQSLGFLRTYHIQHIWAKWCQTAFAAVLARSSHNSCQTASLPVMIITICCTIYTIPLCRPYPPLRL